MLIDNNNNNNLLTTDIITSKSRIQNTNTGARGDYLCLSTVPTRSNRTLLNCIGDKNSYSISTSKFENKADDDFRLNLASGEPKHHQACVSTSSATFIVSSSPLYMTVQHEDHSIQNMNHSKMNMDVLPSARTSHNHQQSSTLKKPYWISVPVIAGIFIIFTIIITIGIIY